MKNNSRRQQLEEEMCWHIDKQNQYEEVVCATPSSS